MADDVTGREGGERHMFRCISCNVLKFSLSRKQRQCLKCFHEADYISIVRDHPHVMTSSETTNSESEDTNR